LQAYLGEHGIASGLHYPIPVHMQPAFAELDYKEGDFPITEACAQEILSLPMYPELTREMVEFVANTIRDFVKEAEPAQVMGD
jgi:dTDP-4-amino-4,6-dideoxygalactose transaminase